ncbi:MFS transporter [Nocardia sp. NPDC050710]|uniref:MFS transporter n=1 Tax=Nocardia sp. NPDC050710 TaxID=3157220 RepID=UPI003403EF95
MPTIETSPDTGLTTDRPHPMRWPAAIVMMVAALMDLLDVTIVNVALPSIGEELHATGGQLQWLVSGYLLGFAATLIIAGHLGDRYGRKALFLIGTGAFGLSSLASGIAQSPTELIAARGIQGVAAALIVPQVLGSFRTLFQGKERGAVFGIYGAIAGFASAIGLLAGGALTDADLFGWGWRSIFLVNVPVAVLVLVFGAWLVPPTTARSAGRPDLLGSLLLAGGLVAIVYPLVQGQANGWPLWGWLVLASGLLAVAGIAIAETRRGATVPLLPARVFRLPAFSVGLVVQLLFSIGMQGFFIIFAIWLQGGQGYTPWQAGVLTAAFAAGGFLTAPPADGLAVRFGRWVLIVGALMMAGGFAWVQYAVHHAETQHTGAWALVPGLLVAGAGLGFLIVPLANVVLSAVPADIASAGSGILSTAQQFGGALGVAVVGTVFFRNVDAGLADAMDAAMPWVIAALLACAVLCTVLPRRSAHVEV